MVRDPKLVQNFSEEILDLKKLKKRIKSKGKKKSVSTKSQAKKKKKKKLSINFKNVNKTRAVDPTS